jgi:hypothetical protein
VGIGWHGVDLHSTGCDEVHLSRHARPFQIPLRALIPKRMENLLPAAKNLGTTHITNGAYRMHPTEWAVGEAAGRLAAFCLEADVSPRQVARDPRLTRRLQAYLVSWGVPVFWFVDTPIEHSGFEGSQLLAAWGLWPADPKQLNFDPDGPLDRAAAASVLRAARVPRAVAEPLLDGAGLIAPGSWISRADFASGWIAAIYPEEQ